jgi:hypothetical protein
MPASSTKKIVSEGSKIGCIFGRAIEQLRSRPIKKVGSTKAIKTSAGIKLTDKEHKKMRAPAGSGEV